MKKISVIIVSILLFVSLVSITPFYNNTTFAEAGMSEEMEIPDSSIENKASGGVSVSGVDKEAPICTGITVRKKRTTKPGYMTVSLSFEENGTGITSVSIQALKKGDDNVNNTEGVIFVYDAAYRWEELSYFGDPQGKNFDVSSMLPSRKLFTETLTFDFYIGDHADASEYYISDVVLEDAAGNWNSTAVKDDMKTAEYGKTLTYQQRIVNDWTWYGQCFETNSWFVVAEEFDYQFEESLSNPNIREDVKKFKMDTQ